MEAQNEGDESMPWSVPVVDDGIEEKEAIGEVSESHEVADPDGPYARLPDPPANAGGRKGDEGEAEVTQDDESRDERLKKAANSPSHMVTHRPKNPFCWVCGLSKMSAKPARRVAPENRTVNEATAFGQHVCVDHIILSRETSEGMHGEKAALFVMDMYSRFIDVAPVANKSGEEALRALRYFLGNTPPMKIYSDNSRELEAAARELNTVHQTSSPYRPQSNAHAERGIRTVVDATRAALLQAGLPHRFWPLAARHQAFALSVQDNPNGQPAPWWLLRGEPFSGWVLPFGCLVHYRPPRPILKKVGKFAPRTLPAIFIGWHVEPGCDFKGDYIVMPISAFQNPDKKCYHGHRIKEMVTFDATVFPLQAAMLETRHGVQAPNGEGENVWPQELQTMEDVDGEDFIKKETIDDEYLEVVGEPAPRHFGFEEKYERIAKELFGDFLEDDGWGGLAGQEDSESVLRSRSEHQETGLDDGITEDIRAEDNATGEARGSRDPAPPNPRTTSGIPWREKIALPKKSSAPCPIVDDNWTNDKGAIGDSEYKEVIETAAVAASPAPGCTINKISNRRLLEFCCGPHSRLGGEKFISDGCLVIRLTIDDDMTTVSGLQKALEGVTSAGRGEYVHLWGSLPCTGGSPWQRINAKYPGARRKIDDRLKTFARLIKAFRIVARAVIKRGGDVSYEWPTGCSLWSSRAVQDMIAELGMHKAHMHGCAVGLVSKGGLPIKKPWTIATTSPVLHEVVGKLICPGQVVHEPCAGAETKRTEEYTDEMAEAVHHAIKEESVSFRARYCEMSMPVVNGEHDEAEKEVMDSPEPSGHREKVCPEGLWCALITKTLAPGDPLLRSPEALAAIAKELAELRKLHVWDEANPKEAKDVAKYEPDAHVARIFPIVGIKHFEDPVMQKYKGRVVLSGDKIKTATGEWATFAELGRVPSTMTACRVLLIVFAIVRDAVILQSDCLRAYVQATMRGPKTYIRLPKPWWPKEWAGRFVDPVCELKRALYGHPHAGDFWGDKFEAELKRLGFVEVEGWTSVYVLYPNGELAVAFIVYVDDLLTVGSSYLVEIFKELRKTIEMEDPAQLKKYLGCVHEITKKHVEGEVVTEVRFNMINYFEAALDQYRAVSSEKLSAVASPFAPYIADDKLDELLNQPGLLAPHAASLVMKLMYGVRMAGPHLSTIVSRLASQISKWNRDSDRRLHRVYCYIYGSINMVLTGTLSTADKDALCIVAWPDADFCGDVMSTRSTSGHYLEVEGLGGRCFPISWGSNKQGGTARCTAESETLSLDRCLAMEAIPAQVLLEAILQRPIYIKLMEDNAATITSITKGYSPSLRHLKRQHQVSLGHFPESVTTGPREYKDCNIWLLKADTAVHKGDLFTKELDIPKFQAAMKMIGMQAVQPEK